MAEVVAVFGSSFDPPTGSRGHGGIVEYLSKRYARVILLPVYVHAFSQKRQNVSYEDKLAMLQAQFDHLGNVEISQVERELAERNPDQRFGTMDVLEHLQQYYKNVQFVFVMGGDTLQDLSMGKWHRSAELLEHVHFLGIPRLNSSTAKPKVDFSKFKHLEMATDIPGMGEVSSSAARALLTQQNGVNDPVLLDLLDSKVIQVIRERKLYEATTPAGL